MSVKMSSRELLLSMQRSLAAIPIYICCESAEKMSRVPQNKAFVVMCTTFTLVFPIEACSIYLELAVERLVVATEIKNLENLVFKSQFWPEI